MHDEAIDRPRAAGQKPTPARSEAWEELEPGRFMPRRVRGSYRGRALG
jgi:hypothetical protein